MQHTFGSFLKELRQKKSLTQKDLSKLLFVSESTISKWEKDVARPDITLLPKLSEIFGVTEHELITASVDHNLRQDKIYAKRWKIFSFSWNLFFYIAYALALIPCFICNLAIDKTLSWFWIVASALLVAFTFTNLPKLITKNKLIFLPLSSFLSLCLLLGVCCIYTGGNWFWIACLSVFLGLVVVFTPIYISKYNFFSKIRKYNDFVSIAVDFVVLNALLIVINAYTLINGYNDNWWYVTIAIPIVTLIYLAINALICVRFLRINKHLKTGLILIFVDLFLYLPPLFVKSQNPQIQEEISQMNVLKANFSNWSAELYLENNIHLIMFLSLFVVGLVFGIIGVIKLLNKK